MDPVLQALLQAAIDATSASYGWVLAVDGEALRVAAAVGPDAGNLLGTTVPGDEGTAGFVVQSGEPIATAFRADDPRSQGGLPARLGRRPTTVLCVPCSTEAGVLGAIELADKADSAAFSLDDVEVATLLAGVAGASLGQGRSGGTRVPPPQELSHELEHLAATDPARYSAMATVLGALLAHG